MTQPVLLGFGDSWSWGAGLESNEKPYIQLLAEKFQVPYYNFAVGSSSIPHLILQFQKFIDSVYFPQNNYHAVFFLTAKERTFVYDQDKTVRHISAGDQHYYHRYYNNELGDFNLNITILALQRLCSLYNIKDYYVQGWQINSLWTTVNHTKFWDQGRSAITKLFHNDPGHIELIKLLDMDGKNPNFGEIDRHPNQLGHAKIAEALAEWIDVHRI
jgi:hypothetical protein